MTHIGAPVAIHTDFGRGGGRGGGILLDRTDQDDCCGGIEQL